MATQTQEPPAPTDRPTRDRLLTLRASSRWLDWLTEAARRERAPTSVIVDQALASWAASRRGHGIPPPPPR